MPAAHSIPGAMSKNLSLCAVAVVFGGCALEEPEAHGTSSSFLVPAPCDDPLICPGNSDLIGSFGPNELDATGIQVSERGFRLLGMTLDGLPVTDFEVLGASLSVTTAAGTFTGVDLYFKGLTMSVHHRSERVFEIQIDDYLTAKVPYYAGGTPEIDGYHLRYREPGAHGWKNACPYETKFDSGVAGSWAVFWKGDRIDPVTGTIFASNAAVGSWFNISCAGTAEIKAQRAHTMGSVAAGDPVDQRQATLNMFTASYCGPGGKRYTELGQAIAWSDLSGPSMDGMAPSIEAIWSEDGAVCLTDPRLFARSDVDCEIPIPYCTAAMTGVWPTLGWLLSGNP